MKCCEVCGTEISTRDGENTCQQCDELETKKARRRAAAKANKSAREDALRSCGLVKVRGAMGGTYWE